MLAEFMRRNSISDAETAGKVAEGASRFANAPLIFASVSNVALCATGL